MFQPKPGRASAIYPSYGTNFARRANQRRLVLLPCPALIEKIFLFFRNQIRCTSSPSRPTEGRSRDRHGRGAGCGGRGSVWRAIVVAGRVDEARERPQGALTRDADCGRRSRVVLTPRRWRQVLWRRNRPYRAVMRQIPLGDGDKKARSPGRARRKPLKPLRREGRVTPVNLW
jgi:hypothetical protein